METQIISSPYNYQFVIMVSFGVEKHGISWRRIQMQNQVPVEPKTPES